MDKTLRVEKVNKSTVNTNIPLCAAANGGARGGKLMSGKFSGWRKQINQPPSIQQNSSAKS